jgi:colicin import membrane protein
VKETRADTVQSLVAAILLHVLLFALMYFGLFWTWSQADEIQRGPVIEATLIDPNALSASMRRALAKRPEQATPAPEEAAPIEQPKPEPRPEDAPTPPQPVAQDVIAEPDPIEQEEVTMAPSPKPPAEKVQEAKQRQEQIDTTAQDRQLQAERERRLSAMEQMRQKQLEDIRRQREANKKELTLREQKLKQIADARSATESTAQADSNAEAAPQPGSGGDADTLRSRWLQAIVDSIRQNWSRPDDVPAGMCPIRIQMERGGRVAAVEVLPGCPYDELTRRSVEAAVLKAQPLPYAGFERVFQPELKLGFRAE